MGNIAAKDLADAMQADPDLLAPAGMEPEHGSLGDAGRRQRANRNPIRMCATPSPDR